MGNTLPRKKRKKRTDDVQEKCREDDSSSSVPMASHDSVEGEGLDVVQRQQTDSLMATGEEAASMAIVGHNADIPNESRQQMAPYNPDILLKACEEGGLLEVSPKEWKRCLPPRGVPMTPRQQQHLRHYHTQIIQTVDITDVLDYMVQDDVINDEQQQVVLSMPSKQEAMRKLKKLMHPRGQRAYYSFAHAVWVTSPKYTVLRKQIQEKASDSSKKAENGGTLVVLSAPDDPLASHCTLWEGEPHIHKHLQCITSEWRFFLLQQPSTLDKEHEEILLDNYVSLVNNLDIQRILPHIVCDGILNEEKLQEVENQNSRQASVRKLLSILRKKGDMGYYSLCHAMAQSCHSKPHSSVPVVGEAAQVPTATQSEVEAYHQRLIEFHEEITSKQQPYLTEASSYIMPITYVGSDELDIQGKRKGIREFVMTPRRKEKAVISRQDLFTKLEELGEERDPRTVLLLGVPGIGKTMFCHRFLEDVAASRLMGNRERYPFLVKFREVNLITEKKSFKDLLFDHFGCTVPNAQREKIWNYLEQNQEKIIFVLDGYDECEGLGAALNKQNTQMFSAVDTPEKPQLLLYNLIAHNILPKAKVLLTSRPHCASQLKKFVKRTVELDGLHWEKLKQLARKDLGSCKPSLCESLLEYFNQHQEIVGMCYVPRHARCLIDYVKENHVETDDTAMLPELMPDTMACLLLIVVIKLLETSDRNLKRTSASYIDEEEILSEKSETLQKLSELAFDGLFSEHGVKQIFSEKDTGKHKLTREELGAGIMSGYELQRKVLIKRMAYFHSFPHLTIQELLASFKLLKLTKKKKVPTATLR